MAMMIIIIINYLKDVFNNSDLAEAHTMQYLILLYHVLYSINVGFRKDKQIRLETET